MANESIMSPTKKNFDDFSGGFAKGLNFLDIQFTVPVFRARFVGVFGVVSKRGIEIEVDGNFSEEKRIGNDFPLSRYKTIFGQKARRDVVPGFWRAECVGSSAFGNLFACRSLDAFKYFL